MAAPVRLGLIGAGRWGRNYIKTIAGLEGIRLAQVASRNAETARLVPAGCAVVSEWRALLNKNEIDGVIIATPPALHAEMTHAAVQAGLPALVEKPLTLDLKEAHSLRDFVFSSKGFVMVGHTHLYHPAFRTLKKIAQDYGEILEIHSTVGNHGPFRPDTPVLWDWGAHDVAMCIDLVNSPPVETKAIYIENRITSEGMGQIVELQLGFRNPIRAVIRVGNILPRQRRFAVRLESAVLVYDDLAEHRLVVYPDAGENPESRTDGHPVPTGRDLPLTCEVREFAKAISAMRRDLSSLDLGVQVVETLARSEAALEATSASSNSPR